MSRIAIGTGVFLLLAAGWTGNASAYRTAEVPEGGTVTGTIRMTGRVPPSKEYDLSRYPNGRYCEKPTDGKGIRYFDEVTALPDATLRDVVIYIKDVPEGKPFDFKGTDVTARDCDFLVQGGPSQFVGVVAKGAELRIVNEDADPDDPAAAAGVLHRPEAVAIKGDAVSPLFSEELSIKGQTVVKTVESADPDGVIRLKCGVHEFMQAYFLPVENPYYAIVGPDGTYTIKDIPPGRYTIFAWHPILGRVETEVDVIGAETTGLDFLFAR